MVAVSRDNKINNLSEAITLNLKTEAVMKRTVGASWIAMLATVMTLGLSGLTHAQDEEENDLYVDRDAGSLHDQLFLESNYPSAHTCGKCHPQHFREWSVSPHAYTTFSPVFQAFNTALLNQTNGTLNDFCSRCHTMVGVNLQEGIAMPASQRNPLTREGITCIVCHRAKDANGKISGRIRLYPGEIFDAVDGPIGNAELKRVIESGDFPVATNASERGQNIHTDVRKFSQLPTSGFCGSCHDVTVPNGFRFEDLFSDFKSAPAGREGIRCQDCHMSKRQGKPAEGDDDFFFGPAAVVSGRPTTPRKLTFHMFVGPDYSIVHPGVFPHNAEAKQFASIVDWFDFDVEAGWGEDDFEDEVSDDYVFPERWEDIDDRLEAREIIETQIELLAEADNARIELMQNALQPGDFEVSQADESGIDFKVEVKNPMKGHSVPSGFDGERLIYMRTTVTDAHGTIVFKSGDMDPNGDTRTTHSLYVHNGELPIDDQLFSLRTRTKTRLFRGGEVDSVLPVNFSPSSLPFVRPSSQPRILFARPRGVRKHKHSIPPLSSRWAKYSVDASLLTGNPPYTANMKLIVQEFPVHLIHEVSEGGFDYQRTPRWLANKVVNGWQIGGQQYGGQQVVFERDLALEVGSGSLPEMEIQEYKRRRVDGFADEYGE